MDGNCICTLCGAEAQSKCPACRSVFPKDQEDAMYSWILKFRLDKDPEKGNWLKVGYFVSDGEDVVKELERLRNALNKLDLKRYSCNHKWVMKPGEHSTIGCGHF